MSDSCGDQGRACFQVDRVCKQRLRRRATAAAKAAATASRSARTHARQRSLRAPAGWWSSPPCPSCCPPRSGWRPGSSSPGGRDGGTGQRVRHNAHGGSRCLRGGACPLCLPMAHKQQAGSFTASATTRAGSMPLRQVCCPPPARPAPRCSRPQTPWCRAPGAAQGVEEERL